MARIASDADNNLNTLMHYYAMLHVHLTFHDGWPRVAKYVTVPPKIKMQQIAKNRKCNRKNDGKHAEYVPEGPHKKKKHEKKTDFQLVVQRFGSWEMADMQSLLKETGLDSHLQVFRIKRLCFHTECSVDLLPLCIKCSVFFVGVCDMSSSSTVLCVLSVSFRSR
jgi:hypothetical protein